MLFLEIPLFHVLNARITFGNIFAMDSPVEYVGKVYEDDRITCVLDEAIFQIPSGYTEIGNGKVQAFFSVFILQFYFFSNHYSFIQRCANKFPGVFLSVNIWNTKISLFKVTSLVSYIFLQFLWRR